mgnify:CR=1 FL=1
MRTLLVLLALLLTACPATRSGGTPLDDDDDATSDDDDDATDAPACTTDYAGHAACSEQLGYLGFCNDGACAEASGCAALSCCVPGQGGDNWCRSQFGDASVCGIVNGDGSCR